MQERLEQTSKELAEIRVQYNDAQKSFEAERTAWINDKKTLEDTIVDMSTSEKHSESDRNSREQELRNLEDRAKVCGSMNAFNAPSHIFNKVCRGTILSRGYCARRINESDRRP